MSFKYILILIILVNVLGNGSTQTGTAIFNNPSTGLNGTITLRYNTLLGTYLVGQIKGIHCFNSSSATKNKSEVSPINNCQLGLTIHNWMKDTNNSSDLTEREWRQTIVNMTNVKLPTIQDILSGNYRPFPSLMPSPTTTPLPTTGANGLSMPINQVNQSCGNVGDIYNPRRDLFAGILGFISPPGIIGNLRVTNGIGSILMGPIELLTAGPTTIIGLPLVIWMDAIRPVLSGNAISLARPPNDRILDCSVITNT